MGRSELSTPIEAPMDGAPMAPMEVSPAAM